MSETPIDPTATDPSAAEPEFASDDVTAPLEQAGYSPLATLDTPVEAYLDPAAVDPAALYAEQASTSRRINAQGVVQTTGRRKEAVARVRLVPGNGTWTLNGKTLEAYFPNKVHQQLVSEPFVTLEKTGRYDVLARLHGGGVSGQAGALRLGIARALIELEAGDRPPLKRAGFLTRDPRVKERKKYGLKKARKAPQYSKR